MKQPKSSLQLPKSTRKTQKVAIASSKKKNLQIKVSTINQKFTGISTPVKIHGTQKAFYQQYSDLVMRKRILFRHFSCNLWQTGYRWITHCAVPGDIHTHPGKVNGNSKWEGVPKHNFFEGKYDAKLEFQEGLGGMDIFWNNTLITPFQHLFVEKDMTQRAEHFRQLKYFYWQPNLKT